MSEVTFESGRSSHIDHPYEFAVDGKSLVSVFRNSIKSLETTPGSVKIDGLNTSVRLINGKFAMDRGSAKSLDINGVRPENLEERFGSGHGFIKIGKIVMQIFDDSISSTRSELKSLGLIDDPTILLNVDCVSGKTNVIGYNHTNFLSIHGLKRISPKNYHPTGDVKSRSAVEISFDRTNMERYIYKLNTVASRNGYKVFGSIDTKIKTKPILDHVLHESLTLYPYGKPVTKSLKEWISNVKISRPLITKNMFVDVMKSKNIVWDFPKFDISKVLNDVVVYMATIKMGDIILKSVTSEIGDLNQHEGIIIRDRSIHSRPFKITGSFITKGMQSKFAE